jgi:hypothetical protein
LGVCRSFRSRSSAPLDELHHQERASVRERPNLVDWRNAGVLELRGNPRLFHEPLRGLAVGRVAVLKEFHRDIAVEGLIAGAVHDAHPTAPDFREQLETRHRGQSVRLE